MADISKTPQEKKESTKRAFIILAIILLVIFIIGILALGVFRFANRGADVIYYRYDIANRILTEESSIDPLDNVTFTYESKNVNNFKEQVTFKASNNATLGIYDKSDSYIYGGKNLTISFIINEENHHLATANINNIKASLEDESSSPSVLPADQYEASLDEESHIFNITFNNSEVLYIYNVVFGYSIV